MSTATTTAIRTDHIATIDCDTDLLRRMIGARIFMSCGARNLLRLTNGGLRFDVSRGGRKLIVVLGADDLFAVERIRVISRGKHAGEAVSEAFVDGVFFEDLPRVVRELGDVES